MNIFRTTLIAFSLVILVNCGGGGSSSTAAARMMGGADGTDMGGADDTADDTNMGGEDGMVMNPLADLANFKSSTGHTSIQKVSGIVSGNSVELLTSSQAQADSFGNEETTTCPTNTLCQAVLPGDTMTPLFSVNTKNIRDISLISPNAYFTNSQYTSTVTSGVTANGVTLARGTLMGTRAETNTPLESQSFAGWLDGSVFGITQLSIGASGNEQYRFISYLAGVPAIDNPTATGSETSATWNGAAVASIKSNRTFILGDAEITVNFTDEREVMNVDLVFDDWRGLDNQAVSGMSAITYNDLTLTDGAFEGLGNDQVEGRFYGQDQAEVGGFFNTMDVTGAFGAKRQ